VITWVDGSDETAEAGTITGEDHDGGTETTDGTYTNDETGIATVTEVGSETTALDGTEVGTLV